MEFFAKPMSELRTDYWMVERLGSGGFAKVYLIRNRQTKRYCAAKHQKLVSKEIQLIARREAMVLRRLRNCDHIVDFIDYFEGEQQSVVATEYLSGGELFARISSQDYSLTEAKCRDFMRQILKGVEFVHKSKILHLDLKPQNIVFVSNFANLDQSQKSALDLSMSMSVSDKLKIIDFGLAREMPLYSDKIPITMCGTLEFMAPEVLQCTYAGPWTDMWSVGVVLYMMVSGGVSPFWAGTDYRTQRRIVRGQYGFNHNAFTKVSSEVLDLIRQLMTVDAKQRMTCHRALDHQWITGSYLDTLKVLETTWMRKYLARRRWHRWFNTIKAMNRMSKILQDDPEEGVWLPPQLQSTVNREKWV